jgi:vitamin B12 transporter
MCLRGESGNLPSRRSPAGREKPMVCEEFPLKRHLSAPARYAGGFGARVVYAPPAGLENAMRKSLILSCATLAMAGVAIGQAEEDQSVIVGSTRLDTVAVIGLRPVQRPDITSSVTNIDASALAVRDTPYIADQLRAVPGIGISRSGAPGALTQVRIRGAEANHTLVLIDGVEVSDPTTGETEFGLFSGLYPSRIEVARGEQSALYGSDAIGGVVNIVSGEQTGARGHIEAGTQGTFRLDGAYGFDLDTGTLNLAFSDYITDGVDTAGLDGEKDGSQNYSGLVNGTYEFGNDWLASGLLRYAYGEVDTDPDLDFDGRLDDADRVTESEQWTLGGALQGEAFDVDHLFRASYNQVERENFGDGASLNTADANRTKFSYSPSLGFEAGLADITLSGLVDWEQEDYTARDTEFGGFTNQDQTFETLGLAGEASASFDSLTLTASARHDDNDGRFDDATTWRAGAAWNATDDAKIRASFGTGVKNPTFTELFGFFPDSFIGNPNLKPEKSQSWELGWDQDFGSVQTSLTYFSAELEDEIFTQFIGFSASPANRAGESERSGVEAAIQWQATDTINLAGALSNISSENDSSVDEIRVPEWTGSMSVNWTSLDTDGLRVGLAADYVGEQSDTDFGTFSNVVLDPYWLVSATAEIPVTERLSVTLRGQNLFDETVTDVFGFNSVGIGGLIGLKLRTQ